MPIQSRATGAAAAQASRAARNTTAASTNVDDNQINAARDAQEDSGLDTTEANGNAGENSNLESEGTYQGDAEVGISPQNGHAGTTEDPSTRDDARDQQDAAPPAPPAPRRGRKPGTTVRKTTTTGPATIGEVLDSRSIAQRQKEIANEVRDLQARIAGLRSEYEGLNNQLLQSVFQP
jgi:hypothetical protein